MTISDLPIKFGFSTICLYLCRANNGNSKHTTMATRATIIVEGQPSVKAYKHWDGYEEATLPWLEEFNKTFTEARGDDPEYKLAQLLRSSARDADKYNLDPSRNTGWGIIPIHAEVWEEYEYHLHADGSVSVKTGNDIQRKSN